MYSTLPVLTNRKITIDSYLPLLYSQTYPYQLSVQTLIDFEQAGDGVNPELVATVPLQYGVGDVAVDLAVQVLSQQLRPSHREQRSEWEGSFT